jgi:hypothetical protein
MDHVVIFDPDHVRSRAGRPRFTVAVEARDRPGPAYKAGVGSGEVVWIRMGPLVVAKATVDIAWHGEYAMLKEIRNRTKGTELFDQDGYWQGKAKIGYAVVAKLRDARWLPEPQLGGPRTYAYDWVVLENEKKEDTWLDLKPPESKDAGLVRRLNELKAEG